MKPYVALAAATVMLAVACSWGAREPGPEELDYGRLPLDAIVHPGPDAVASEVEVERRFHVAYEQSLGACLRDLGFEYTERTFIPDESLNPIDLRQPLAAQERWVEAHGYGITTWIDADDTVADVARRRDDLPFSTGEPPDPNARYVSELDDAMRDAYWDAYGDPGGAGCESGALGAGSRAAAAAENELGTAADSAIRDQVLSALVADPAYAAAESYWTACMTTRGWDVERIEEATELVAQRLADLLDGTPRLDSRPDPRALAELQAFELALASDHWECHRDEVFARQRAIEARIQEELAATIDVDG